MNFQVFLEQKTCHNPLAAISIEKITLIVVVS